MKFHWIIWLLGTLWLPGLISSAVPEAYGARGFAWFCITAVIVAMWVRDTGKGKVERIAQKEAATQQRSAEIDAFFARDMVPIAVPEITLKAGERCYFSAQVSEVQPVKETVRVGGYGGPSIRLARGLYWRTGAFASKGVSSTKPQVTDKGVCYLTNARVLFVGSNGTKAYAYDSIISNEYYNDGFRLDIANRKPTYYLTPQPSMLGMAFERIRQGIFVGRQTIAAMNDPQ